MVTTVATIIIDRKPRIILVAHVTEHNFWSLPKGIQEENESMIATAIREVKEETGIDFEEVGAESPFTYHGTHAYIKGKARTVLSIEVDRKDLPRLKCSSTFISDIDGEEKPEVDDYLWTNGDGVLSVVNKAQAVVLRPILEELCLIKS